MSHRKMMKNKYKKLVIKFAVFVLTFSLFPTVNVFASNEKNEQGMRVISQEEVAIVDKYIYFDNSSSLFKIDEEGLKNKITPEVYNAVLLQVSSTNKTIVTMLNSSDSDLNIRLVNTSGKEIVLREALTRGRGVNDIVFHWNYARVFIDAGNVTKAMQVGCVLGGIFIPSAAVKAACGILGIFAGDIVQHGIWFDYNYFIGILCGNCGLQ